MRVSLDVAWMVLAVIVAVLFIMACFGFPGSRRQEDG